MTMKLPFLFFMFAAFSTEKNTNELLIEETLMQQLQDLDDDFPNKSTVKLFRDVETDEIFWEDPKELIPKKKKESIESSLNQNGKDLSNGLFDCISDWYFLPDEAHPFVKELIYPMSKNVDVEKRGIFKKTPLMMAAFFDAEEAVSKLAQRGAKMEAIDENGCTALHVAAREGNEAPCEVLLRKGAQVNAQGKYGYTPLMMAAGKGHAEVVKILLRSGAYTKITNGWGKSAVQIALENGKPNCADLIKAHGNYIRDPICLFQRKNLKF